MTNFEILEMLKSVPQSMTELKRYGVVMDYDEVFDIGVIAANDMEEGDADGLCQQFVLMVPDHEFIVMKQKVEPPENVKIVPRYCSKCGGSGYTLDGEICDCKFDADTFFREVSCMEIPEQYRSVHFNEGLVPTDVDRAYARKLSEIYNGISTARIVGHNYLICSPHRHSKTIMAYSCIERLFKGGMPVFPVYDIMEIRRIMRDVDNGKDCFLTTGDPEDIWTVPYLFVKLPVYPTWEVYDSIDTLLNRRVRRGGSTILLYSGKYSNLTRNDSNDLFIYMRGDGSFNSIDVIEFQRTVRDEED